MQNAVSSIEHNLMNSHCSNITDLKIVHCLQGVFFFFSLPKEKFTSKFEAPCALSSSILFSTKVITCLKIVFFYN